MSDNNTKQKPQAPQQKQVKKSGSSGSRFFIGLIALLALLLAGAASGLGYYAWLELNKQKAAVLLIDAVLTREPTGEKRFSNDIL